MNSFQRSGKWTKEEEEYATEIVKAFHGGTLDIHADNEISLRRYLAKRLMCSPKRVSKKYESSGYNGKVVFVRSSTATPEEIQGTMNRIKVLEANFLSSIESTKATGVAKRTGVGFPPSAPLSPPASTSQIAGVPLRSNAYVNSPLHLAPPTHSQRQSLGLAAGLVQGPNLQQGQRGAVTGDLLAGLSPRSSIVGSIDARRQALVDSLWPPTLGGSAFSNYGGMITTNQPPRQTTLHPSLLAGPRELSLRASIGRSNQVLGEHEMLSRMSTTSLDTTRMQMLQESMRIRNAAMVNLDSLVSSSGQQILGSSAEYQLQQLDRRFRLSTAADGTQFLGGPLSSAGRKRSSESLRDDDSNDCTLPSKRGKKRD